MKPLFYLTYCFLLFFSCKKEKLTKETQEGANTFSCKVDGDNYIAQIQGVSFSGAKPIVVHNFQNDGFTISTIDSRTGATYSKNIIIHLPYLQTTGTFSLNNSTGYAQYKLNYTPGPVYQTNAEHSGTVIITRCDTVNKIYSGTFSFSAIDANTGKVVRITNGRFDVQQE